MDDMNGNIQRFGNFSRLQPAAGLSRRTVAEDAGKMYRCYLDSLIDHQPDGKGAVQAAGEEGNGFTIHRQFQASEGGI
jgi:hypothetical protein